MMKITDLSHQELQDIEWALRRFKSQAAREIRECEREKIGDWRDTANNVREVYGRISQLIKKIGV